MTESEWKVIIKTEDKYKEVCDCGHEFGVHTRLDQECLAGRFAESKDGFRQIDGGRKICSCNDVRTFGEEIRRIRSEV